MNAETIAAAGVFTAAPFAFRAYHSRHALDAFLRLKTLFEQDPEHYRQSMQEIIWTEDENTLLKFRDSLGKAGFISKEERKTARLLEGGVLLSFVFSIGFLGWDMHEGKGAFVGAAAGLYLGFTAWVLYLAHRSKELSREILFQTPLTLESLILLVESGLSILPAIQQLVTSDSKHPQKNPVTRLLRLVYQLSSHGVPFGQSLEMVGNTTEVRILRHVLLHLDISGNEGGELIPSLRSLSEHAHKEWKLSVESRVRRLENLVVFPVFIAVIGLMFITAAAPLVPVLELRDSLNRGSVFQQNDFSEHTYGKRGAK